MEQSDDIVNVFMGSQHEINMLKQIFNDFNLPILIKNEFSDGSAAGYVSHSEELIGVYVFTKDKTRAMELIEEFRKAG